MRFTKNLLGYVLFLSIFLLFSCHPKKKNTCNVEISSFSLLNNAILIKTINNKSCKGFMLKVTYNKRIFTFYVNFEPKIVNNAPPDGFSVKIQNRHYTSLGVDGNIIEKDLPVCLKSESKIKILKDHILIKWLIRLEDIGKLSKIELPSITIKHPSNDECRFAYNNHLTTPRQKPVFYPFDKFLNFCKSKWIAEEKNKPYIEIFKLSYEDIKKLQKRGDTTLLNFLGFSKQSNHSSKGSCNIHILLYDSKNYEKLNPKKFKFHLEKLNKETYERDFDKDSIDVANGGVYVIRATSGEYSGKSKVIICKGGKYYVAILVKGDR